MKIEALTRQRTADIRPEWVSKRWQARFGRAEENIAERSSLVIASPRPHSLFTQVDFASSYLGTKPPLSRHAVGYTGDDVIAGATVSLARTGYADPTFSTTDL